VGSASGQEAKAAAFTPSQPAQLTNTLKVTNIVPDFLGFWTAAESKDETTQIRMFRQMVMQPHPELFAENVVNLGQKQGIEEENRRIAAYLRQIPQFIPAIRVLNDRLQTDLQTYIRDFAVVFPDFHPSTPVYFTVSLGHFNGAVREVGGKDALLLGWTSLPGTDPMQRCLSCSITNSFINIRRALSFLNRMTRDNSGKASGGRGSQPM